MTTIPSKINKTFLFISVFLLLICFAFSKADAGQVTMATYDFNDDGVDEIIRTDEQDAETFIRIYEKIDDSFFYVPLQTFRANGRLVQVPEIIDINKDGQLDYYFATGSDMGVIYYDHVLAEFVRTNDFDFDVHGYNEKKGALIPDARPADTGLTKLQKTLTAISDAEYELNQLKDISRSEKTEVRAGEPTAPKIISQNEYQSNGESRDKEISANTEQQLLAGSASIM
jgi:hypothetical protein